MSFLFDWNYLDFSKGQGADSGPFCFPNRNCAFGRFCHPNDLCNPLCLAEVESQTEFPLKGFWSARLSGTSTTVSKIPSKIGMSELWALDSSTLHGSDGHGSKNLRFVSRTCSGLISFWERPKDFVRHGHSRVRTLGIGRKL